MHPLHCKPKTVCFAVVTTCITGFGILLHFDALKKVVTPENASNHTKQESLHRVISYDKDSSLIFVGGMPRSGTTLMRAMLDAHPLVRCGPETMVVPRLLDLRAGWLDPGLGGDAERLRLAGLSRPALDAAVAAFLLEVIARHGPAAPVLCNKDPFVLRHAVFLGRVFPNARFIFLVRDGRAVVHSIVSRGVSVRDFDPRSPGKCLAQWDVEMRRMYGQCRALGPGRCLPVYYEQLVLRPHRWMRRVLRFLQLPWDEAVLRHQDYVGKAGGVQLSRLEYSTDQVVQPINTRALVTWVGKLPPPVLQAAGAIAPMLRVLGYDFQSDSPNYGEPESRLSNSSLDTSLQPGDDFWINRTRLMFHDDSALYE